MILALALSFLMTRHDNGVLFRRMFLIIGITALLRPLTFTMTSLPDPSPHNPCRTYLFRFRLFVHP